MKKIPNLNKIRDDKRLFYNPNEHEKSIYTQIKKELENKYSIEYNNRNMIIKQLIATLTHGNYKDLKIPKINLLIIRTDIKDFFPSINKHLLFQKLMNSNILSNNTLNILKEMLFSPRVTGIPLGLPFSNALSEIYLESFDVDIYQNFNPNFYFRYVDDIVIINYDTLIGEKRDDAHKTLEDIFLSNKLKLNTEKTFIDKYNPNNEYLNTLNFNYLGYNFKIFQGILHLKIADEKYKKVIDKIEFYFKLYKKSSHSNKDFWLLYYRLLNILYGITSLDKHKRKMRFGLGYNYKFVNDKNQIYNLIAKIKTLSHTSNLHTQEKSIIFYLIHTKNDSIELLQKRFDYTKITFNQLDKIAKRLQISAKPLNINVLFNEIYKNT